MIVVKTHLATLAVAVTSLFANPAAGQQFTYQCYVETAQYYNLIPVDISYQCCSDTQRIYDANYHALRNEAEDCSDEILEELMVNDDYCNRDFTHCTIDYAEFACDDAFLQSCARAGGKRSEADVVFDCDDGYGGRFSMTFYDKADCFAPSCSDQEIVEVYRVLSNSMDCTVRSADNFKMDGQSSSLSIGGEDDDKYKIAIVVGVAIAGVMFFTVALVIGLLLYFQRSKRQRTAAAAAAPSKAAALPIAVASPLSVNSVVAKNNNIQEVEETEEVLPDGTKVVRKMTKNADGSTAVKKIVYRSTRNSQSGLARAVIAPDFPPRSASRKGRSNADPPEQVGL